MTWKEVIFPALVGVALVVVCSAIGYNAGRRSVEPCGETVVTRTDTVTVHDTLRIVEPKEVERTRIKTVYVPISDTLTLHDTLYIRLDREQIRYSDSTYTAYVSGIRPKLDSIFVFPATKYISTTVETTRAATFKRWRAGVGVQVGYGMTAHGMSPYAGIGVNFGYSF